jgi:2'-5' RNA ligase
MAKIRTFIAVKIPDDIKREADKLIVSLKSFGPDVRWVRAANLHFTLRFLGDIEQDDVEKLSEAIKKNIAGIKSFPLKLSGLGCFPNMRRPRVVWVGGDGDMDTFKSLAVQVEAACLETGFGKADKPFSAHLTIGRIKIPRGIDQLIRKLESTQFESEEFAVDRVIIYKSDLSPRGPTYTSLAEVELS